MPNQKIILFSKNNEIGLSFQKYFQYVQNREIDVIFNPNNPSAPSEEHLLLILELVEDKVEDKDNQENFLQYLLTENLERIPLTLILNPERSLNNYFETKKDPRGDYDFRLFAFTEIFYDYYIPISIPFEIGRISQKLPQEERLYPNPFFKIEEVIDSAKEIFKDKNFPAQNSEVIEEAGKWIFEETRKRREWGAIHGEEDKPTEDKKRKMWFYRILLSYLFQKRDGRPLRVLWIENNPKRELEKIDSRLENIINPQTLSTLSDVMRHLSQIFKNNFIIDIIQTNFTEAYKRLCNFRRGRELSEFSGGITFGDLEKYSLILVDIFLEKDSREKVDGIKFIQAFAKLFPHIPAFILSVSDNFEEISEAIKNGADFYILKSDVLSLPFAYYLYIRKLGRVLEFIKDEELKKSLIGNIRYWNFKRNLLWFGDKCYHMVEHAFQHTKEDWEIANNILYPLFREKKLAISDEMLYSFLMAIWLHDIGHKGNKKYGEPHQIRDNHGYLSAELFLPKPFLFGIVRGDDFYRGYESTKPDSGSLLEVMLNRVEKEKRLSIPEKIALFSIYHKGNCPITTSEYLTLVSKKKFIPFEYYQNRELHIDKIITLERIVEKLELEKDKDLIIPLAFLFRFIDSLDIRFSRVGDFTEEELKKKVIKNDKEYIYEKLIREAKLIAPTKAEELLYVSLLGKGVIDRIEAQENITLDELKPYLS